MILCKILYRVVGSNHVEKVSEPLNLQGPVQVAILFAGPYVFFQVPHEISNEAKTRNSFLVRMRNLQRKPWVSLSCHFGLQEVFHTRIQCSKKFLIGADR